MTGFRTERIRVDAGRARLVAEDGRELPPADTVVVLTGFRPDLSFLSEMRLDLDPVLQAPSAIAPSIDPNIHSCGTAAPTLAADLIVDPDAPRMKGCGVIVANPPWKFDSEARAIVTYLGSVLYRGDAAQGTVRWVVAE